MMCIGEKAGIKRNEKSDRIVTSMIISAILLVIEITIISHKVEQNADRSMYLFCIEM